MKLTGGVVFDQIIPISVLQSRDLITIRVILIINLLPLIVLAVAAWLLPYPLPMLAITGDRGAAQSAEDGQSLEPGKPIERELTGGQSHFYRIGLTSGQYLQIAVNQRGIDVLVTLYAPDGKKIGEVNSAPVTVASETMSVIGEMAGIYRIEVRSSKKAAKTGRYEIKIEAQRGATSQDKYRVAAEVIYREAKQIERGTLYDKRKSIKKYDEALELYRKAGDRKWEATTLTDIGVVHWLLGEMQKALEKYNESLPIRREVGDRSGEAVTLNNISLVYQSLGELQKALEKNNESLSIRREIGDRGGEAVTLNNIGLVYESIGEMQKALEKYNESLPIRREVDDRVGEAATLNNIGGVYQSLGEMRRALEKYNEALPIRREVRDRRGEAFTLNSIGTVYQLLGEIQKALEKYNESLPIRREVGDRVGEASTLNSIGTVYLSLGELQKALEKLNEALPIRRAVGNRYGEAVTLTNIGAVYQSLGEMQKALEKFNEALLIQREVGDRRAEAIILGHIGRAYRSSGEIQKALEKFNEALPIIRAVGDRRAEATALTEIGAVYLSLGELPKALEKLNEALPIRRAVGDRYGEASTLLMIAQAEQKRGNLTLARQTIGQATDIIESLRTDISSQQLRASYFASRQEFYQSYIDILMEQHKQNPAAAFDAAAFAVSERARARSLLELLTESRVDIRQGVDVSLLERERSLQQLLNAKAAVQARLLNRKHTPEQADAAAKEIASITSEYDEVRAQIRSRSPRYAALTQPQPLNLAEIQQQVLDEDTLLLEYALGENRSYLWLVSRRSIDAYELPPRAEIETATRRVYELLAVRPKRGTPPDPQWIKQAQALSRMLLGPIVPRLGSKRLVVVTPGTLSYLPFAALPVPADEKQSAAGYQPLAARHEIVNLPSASVLSVIRREMSGRQRATQSIAVLADPVFEANDPRLDSAKNNNVPAKTQDAPSSSAEVNTEESELTRAVRTMNFSNARTGFTRLVFSRQEADSIFALVSSGTGLKATDFNASRALVLSGQLNRYRILHFATHGLLNSEHPELSGLVFSLVDREGRPQDGFLRLHEVYNFQLNADLIVLSACETGLGKEIKGEGLIGLTRGFMYSGVPRVVASLWNVDDLATAELMKLFYRGLLKDGLPAAAALRAAQIEMSKQKRWASPYFWAGFVLQGEWK
jgi:CHAT domain-containing protein/tetratricopeptide (TPR) repeat protein